MDKTEFIQLEEFDVAEDESPDAILENAQKRMTGQKTTSSDDDFPSYLLDEPGL